jgi:G3E family GTPase
VPVKPKIPVTIVTGFLGSGKTTFINNLLLQNYEVKIGLIENEFGDVSIDSKLIANYKPESILELNNGCICCSIFNEFSLALQELIKKNDHLEQLIIETSGIADPGPIIEPFFQDPDLERLFELSGTICLVDSVNFQEEIGNFEQQKQIMLSDLIILNKVDDADQKKLAYIRKKIAALNKTAQVVETNFAFLDSSNLYMLLPQIQDEFIKKLRKPFYCEPESSDFHSFTIRFGGYINEQSFREWFKYFASVYRKQIFRIKGLVNFENNPLTGIVQSVGGMTNISEGSVANPYEPLENVFVFVGKEISKFEVEKMFQQYLLQVK